MPVFGNTLVTNPRKTSGANVPRIPLSLRWVNNERAVVCVRVIQLPVKLVRSQPFKAHLIKATIQHTTEPWLRVCSLGTLMIA
jgi:hypothetical protein